MRVAVYARVSTTRQETENQLQVLREYVARQAWTIEREYVEEVSAGGSKRRDEFNAMMDAARRRQFDIVLFWSLDRFSREGALKTLQQLEQLYGYGVGWKSYTEQYLDSAGIFRDAIVSIIATLAKQERLRIQERVRAGLDRARREGKQLGRQPKIVDREKVRAVYQETRSLRKTAEACGIGKDLVQKIVNPDPVSA